MGAIWDFSDSRIARIMDEETESWSAVGLMLSILSVTVSLNAPMFKPKDWATYMGESDEVDDVL